VNELRINGERLLSRLGELAAIGAIDGTDGCARLALTNEDKAGRDLVVTWMRDLGMDVTVDGIGNVVATWVGPDTDATLTPVMTGSHIDTVKTGGRYDGNLGVLAGLEIVETLAEAGHSPVRPIAVAFFTDEEGARFAPDMLGSLVYVGGMSLEQALDIEDMETWTALGLAQNWTGSDTADKRRARGPLRTHTSNYTSSKARCSKPTQRPSARSPACRALAGPSSPLRASPTTPAPRQWRCATIRDLSPPRSPCLRASWPPRWARHRWQRSGRSRCTRTW